MMENYLKWFLSLPQLERIELIQKYTHMIESEMNETMAKAIFDAENRDTNLSCPQCYERTIIDCKDKTCLSYVPK